MVAEGLSGLLHGKLIEERKLADSVSTATYSAGATLLSSTAGNDSSNSKASASKSLADDKGVSSSIYKKQHFLDIKGKYSNSTKVGASKSLAQAVVCDSEGRPYIKCGNKYYDCIDAKKCCADTDTSDCICREYDADKNTYSYTKSDSEGKCGSEECNSSCEDNYKVCENNCWDKIGGDATKYGYLKCVSTSCNPSYESCTNKCGFPHGEPAPFNFNHIDPTLESCDASCKSEFDNCANYYCKHYDEYDWIYPHSTHASSVCIPDYEGCNNSCSSGTEGDTSSNAEVSTPSSPEKKVFDGSLYADLTFAAYTTRTALNLLDMHWSNLLTHLSYF